jgi:hypothetical protein
MRTLLFLLMIAMLPLRGWVGDAMATEMAVMQVQHHPAHHAEHAHQPDTAGTDGDEAMLALTSDADSMHDCEGQAPTGEPSANGDHCATCAACQACHTVALSATTATTGLHFSPVSAPPADTLPFASAEAALRQKPPIS